MIKYNSLRNLPKHMSFIVFTYAKIIGFFIKYLNNNNFIPSEVQIGEFLGNQRWTGTFLTKFKIIYCLHPALTISLKNVVIICKKRVYDVFKMALIVVEEHRLTRRGKLFTGRAEVFIDLAG